MAGILDPQMAEILRLRAEAGLPPLETLDVAAARAQADAGFRVWNEDSPAVEAVADLKIAGPAGPLPLRLYTPHANASPRRMILFLHGGGWVVGSIASHDALCRRLALASGLRVASVDYRLAPEVRCPGPVEDAVAAFQWAARQADEVLIAGDSAGANLALAASLILRDGGHRQPHGLVLAYGAFGAPHDTASHRAYGGGRHLLTTATMAWYWAHYLGYDGPPRDALAAPLLADLRGLPPMFLGAAEFDPLLDDSLILADRLGEAKVPAALVHWRGVTHGSLLMSRLLAPADTMIGDMARWVAAT